MAANPTNPGSYGSTGTTAPTTGTPVPQPAATAPVTTGSFPQTPQGTGLGVNGIPVANISVNNFLADYGISSTEQAMFLTQGANGQPQLNQNALFLMQYKAMDATERQNYQEALVNAGLLPPADANGINNPTALSAFKTAIANSAATGVQVDQYLQQYQGTNNVNMALAAATGRAEQEAQAPVTASLENPTTLAAQITAAFDQTVGYAPNQDQINAFISQIQGQDVANAEAPHQAAQAQLAQLKSDQSALSKLGPDGINSIVSAYTNAIHGINPNAGNPADQQGVATSSLPLANNPNYIRPGTPLPPDTTVGFNPSGAEMVANVPPTISTTTQQVPPGGLAQLGHAASSALNLINPFSGWNSNQINSDVSGLTGAGTPYSTRQVTTSTPGQGMAVAPNLPPGLSGTIPVYGGIYALTPADWTEIKKLMPRAKLPATPGAATPAEQEVGFKTLLQNVYDNNGQSWADAIIKIAGGDNTVPGSNLHSFATNIANQVNDQLTQLANTVNTQSVTEKTTAPDATAEANLAAKSADPVGYTAANAATAGSLLNQMLAGAPQMYGQGTADTFTGPAVGSGISAGAATTPTTVAA